MKSIRNMWFLMALSLSLLMILPLALGQNAIMVGVKAGDLVKYNITSLGSATVWEDFYDKAVWIKVEVQNVSVTNVTVLETRHLQDGREEVSTVSWNLNDSDPESLHYGLPMIIPANLDPGGVIGRLDVWQMADGKWVNVKLTLNYSDLRNYGGILREVNVLEFSHCLPYFEYIANFSHKIFWDKETGFLLERIDQRTLLGYEKSPSIVTLEISDTNMWDFKMKQPFSWQFLTVGIVGFLGTTAVGAIFLKQFRKSKENKAEVPNR